MKSHTSKRNWQMTWAQAKIFGANIAKLKRTSKTALALANWQKRRQKGGIKPVPSKKQGIPNGERSRKHKRSRSCRLSLRREGHGFSCRKTFVSNAKTESILGGIHTRFENSSQMNINVAHIYLLPASCPSKNRSSYSHQNQFRQNTYGVYNFNLIKKMLITNKNIPLGKRQSRTFFSVLHND